MAPLAIDALRQRSGISRLGPGFPLRCGNSRIGVVAGHALVVDRARGPLVIQPVVARIHRPVAALFRIPAQRQLLERVPRGQVQKGPRMIAGAEHVIDLLLFDVGVPAVEPDLPSPLIEFAAPLEGFEVGVRCLMEEGSCS